MGGVCQHWSLPGSVEIALTADVAVAQGLVVGRLVEESAIEAALEDRTDRGDGASLDQDGASAGGIDARFVVAAVGARHVIGDGGVATPVGGTGVAGNPLSLVEDLDGLVSDAYIDEFTDQAVRGGIPMAVDLDVIVGGDAATLPARKDVGLVRQRSQLETIDLGEQFGAAGAETAHLAGVEFNDQPADSGIEFRQGKEALIAQAGQDPALRDLDGDLNLRLVLWPPRPRRQDRGAVMAGHLGIGAVDPGIVTIGVGHAGLELITDDELRHTAEIPE